MKIFQDRARRRWFIGIATIAALVLFVLSRGCSFAGGPVSGLVRDIDTLQPIAGAMVVAQWEGTAMGPVHSRSVCFHVETAVSDADGRYRMPFWFQAPPVWSVYGTTTIRDAYLPGYESVRTHQTQSESPEDVFMKKYAGSDAERFEYISRGVFGAMTCGHAGSSARNLYPVLRAAFREAKALASSAKENSKLEGMRRIAAKTWLARAANSISEPEPITKVPDEIRRDLE